MDIKLCGSCNTITASVKDNNRISIRIGKSGPVLYLEACPSTKKEEDLEKLDKADSEKLDKAGDSERLNKGKDLESSDQTKDLKSGQAKDLKSLSEAKDLRKLDQVKDSRKLNKGQDLGKFDQGKDSGKHDGAKASKSSEKSKLTSPDKSELKSPDQIKVKSTRSKEVIGKKSAKKKREISRKDTKEDSVVKISAKERSRITEAKLAKEKAAELSRNTSQSGFKKQSSRQSSRGSLGSMKNIAAMEIPGDVDKSVSFEYQVPIMTAIDSTQEGPRLGRMTTGVYSGVLRPAATTYRKLSVDPHINCFPPLSFQKKEPRRKSFAFNSQTTFVDRHKNCFPDFIRYKTFSSSKSKTHLKTYTEYHKNCVPKYPGEQSSRKRKMSVSEEVLTPATVKKTLLERHKNCIPVMDFKDTYFKTEEQKRRLSGSTASIMSSDRASHDRIINRFDTKVIPTPKLQRGDTLPKRDMAVPMAEPEKTANEELDAVIDDNNAETDEETLIPSPNLPADDENGHSLQETNQDTEQPLLS
ncbi:Hypothetical predicted protein [Octopus vulgaris]|uniref:Uncharacterized protein n=1 Tax=Octopus vulgaris TaxID=6645 RepID=A0AA36F8U7_OCTVU|nr:Hypothetical predicted protein [Octopus vulgaris]